MHSIDTILQINGKRCIWVNADISYFRQIYIVVVLYVCNAIIQEAFMVMLLPSGSFRILSDEAGRGSENTDKL